MAPRGIAEALADVARNAQAAPDLDQTLERVVVGAADTITGVEDASISLIEGGKIRTVAPTSSLVELVDGVQGQVGEGPCVDAIEENHTFRTGDVGNDKRWLKFGPEAARLGVRSMMAFQLLRPHDGRILGALNLYSRVLNAFDLDAEHIGALFATHATIALIGELDRTQLRAAVSTRDTIGTAKGILMHQHTCTEEHAFAMLSAASQRANVKLREVAGWVVADANRQATQ